MIIVLHVCVTECVPDVAVGLVVSDVHCIRDQGACAVSYGCSVFVRHRQPRPAGHPTVCAGTRQSGKVEVNLKVQASWLATNYSDRTISFSRLCLFRHFS